MQERYDMRLAAAYVRGMAREGRLVSASALADAPLHALTSEEQAQLIEAGRARAGKGAFSGKAAVHLECDGRRPDDAGKAAPPV